MSLIRPDELCDECRDLAGNERVLTLTIGRRDLPTPLPHPSEACRRCGVRRRTSVPDTSAD